MLFNITNLATTEIFKYSFKIQENNIKVCQFKYDIIIYLVIDSPREYAIVLNKAQPRRLIVIIVQGKER